MLFSPCQQGPEITKRGTYDLEWYKGTYRLRVAGLYVDGRYRHFDSIEGLLGEMLSWKRRGYTYWAHAGGLADFQFLLPVLAADKSFEVDAIFSGASAIIVRIRKGRAHWTLADSYWLFHAKLADVAKGYTKRQKGDVDTETAPLSELIEYNALDCIILHEAIGELQKVLRSLGGALRLTNAGCALHLFRAQYLKTPIHTNSRINDLAREAYHAARVEAFRTTCDRTAYVRDINSSFPASMARHSHPGTLHYSDRKLGGIYLARITARSTGNIPPLPLRVEGRLYFPTGRLADIWVSNADVEALERTGGTIEEVKEVLHFRPFDDFRPYVEVLYRMKADDDLDGALRETVKRLLNGTYGKFAERREKVKAHFGRFDGKCPHSNKAHYDPETGEALCVTMVAPGIFLISDDKPLAHEWVPISQSITAHSRLLLLDGLLEADNDPEDELYYTDTDCIVQAKERERSNALGAWKDEGTVKRAHFKGPKCYLKEYLVCPKCKGPFVGSECPKCHKARIVIKAKGLPRLDEQTYWRYVNGEKLEYERMMRIPELIHRSEVKHRITAAERNSVFCDNALGPRDVSVSKQLSGRELPKRRPLPDGGTAPWDVESIRDYYCNNGSGGA